MKPLKNFQFPHEQGKFAAIRKHDIHTGIDLYCNEGEPVYAIEDGEVVRVEPFTGKSTDSPWWQDTHCVVVKGKSGFILYGEVKPKVFIGDKVKEGQYIANVKTVLMNNKGLPTTMLHLELYDKNVDPVVWNLNCPKPEHLCDPSFLVYEKKKDS